MVLGTRCNACDRPLIVAGCPLCVTCCNETPLDIWCSYCQLVDVATEGAMCPGCQQQWDEESAAIPVLTAEDVIAAALVQQPDPAEVVAVLRHIDWRTS